MDLVCPTCKYTQPRAFLSARLPTCPRCERAGRSSYLVPLEEAKRRWRRFGRRENARDAT